MREGKKIQAMCIGALVCAEPRAAAEALWLVSSGVKHTSSSVCLPPGASVPCTSLSPGAPGDVRTRKSGEADNSSGDCGTLSLPWAGFPQNLVAPVL